MPNRDRWQIRGPVRICRQIRWNLANGKTWSDETYLEFRRDGSLAQMRHRNPDASEWSTQEQSGTPEPFEVDEAGRKKRTVIVSVPVQGWNIEGSDTGYAAQGAASVSTIYNDRDQPVEVTFHDEHARALSRVDLTYNEAGKLVEESQVRLIPPPSLPFKGLNAQQMAAMLEIFRLHRAHKYDERGRRVESITKLGSLSTDRKVVTYSDHDDPVEEVEESVRQEMSMNEDRTLTGTGSAIHKARSSFRFSYIYDEHGNWTEKTTGGESGDITRENRTFEYFD